MKRNEFLENEYVRSFIEWLSNYLASANIELRISKKGTGKAKGSCGPGVKANCRGLQDVLNNYTWRSQWSSKRGQCSVSMDWPTTSHALNSMSEELKESVNNGDDAGSLEACNKIIVWGGDRDSKKGAIPFLKEINNNEGISKYLLYTRKTLDLETTDIETLPYIKINSMLTKVHSLNSYDGLPIYDSRVAAASSALVQAYISENKIHPSELPDCLHFHIPFRKTKRKNKKTIRDYSREPSGMRDKYAPYHAPGFVDGSSKLWIESKIKLGWLISETIRANENILPDLIDVSLERKMHAFEACLFMIGYDVNCIA